MLCYAAITSKSTQQTIIIQDSNKLLFLCQCNLQLLEQCAHFVQLISIYLSIYTHICTQQLIQYNTVSMFKLVPTKQPYKSQSLHLLEHGIPKQQQIVYLQTRARNQILTSVCLADSMLILRQCSTAQNIQLRVTVQQFEQQQLNQISYAFVEGGDAFLVYTAPFKIYYLTPSSPKPIKLILAQQFSFKTGAVIDLCYPNLIIYGTKIEANNKQNNKCEIYELCMDTLIMKCISGGNKDYRPDVRHESISIIADDRIYTFGGKDSKNRPCEQVLWVYDMEKGYWFALDMQYPQDENFSLCETVPITSSKVLIISKNSRRAWVLEVHQSKLTEVEDFGEFSESDKQMVCVKGELVKYSSEGWEFWGKEVAYFKK